MPHTKHKKEGKKQVVEIHIYVHQVPNYLAGATTTVNPPCPVCGKTYPHTCVTC